jgi:hypothetical protein
MSAVLKVARPLPAPVAIARPPATLGRAAASPLARRVAVRLGNEWLPRAVWAIGRTGRPGLVGLAALLASAVFLFSTHLRVAAEVEARRADLAAARERARPTAADPVVAPAAALRELPARADMPVILGQLFNEATRARLAVDTARYEVSAARGSGVVRHQITFPVSGPYPQIRAFIDATLAGMPAVGLSELVLERKSIADGNVEAQIRMTVYTRSAP